jgi:hypothetical protein
MYFSCFHTVSTQLLIQLQHLPQQDQPWDKKHKHAKQRPHSSGTHNSKNQHKIMKEEIISAVIKNNTI